MNTKTMRLPPRRVLTSDKRKERDEFISSIAEKSPGTAVTKHPPSVSSNSMNLPIAAESVGSNQLILPGYLSHEFLTNGTLFGDKWSLAQTQLGPFSAQSVEPNKVKPIHIIESGEESEPKRKRYVEVACILRADGAYLPGIVNPAQLARFLKL